MSLIFLTVIFLLFGVCAWLSTVEAGIGLMRLLPTGTKNKMTLEIITPAWEVTNIFLVFAFAAFIAIFSNSLSKIVDMVSPFLIICGVAVLIRSALILYFYYFKPRLGFKLPNLLFVLSCLVFSLSLGAIGIYLISGANFWDSLLGTVMFTGLILGVASLSIAFYFFKAGIEASVKLKRASRISNLLLYINVSIIMELLVNQRLSHIYSLSYELFALFIVFVPLWQLSLWYDRKESYMWLYLSVVAVLYPLLIALSNRPYLLYPNILIAQAYGSGGFSTVALISLVAIFIIVALSLLILGIILYFPDSRKAKIRLFL